MMVPRLLLALLLLPSLAIADESQVVPLWPGGAPGHEGKNVKEKVVESGKGQRHDRRVSSIHEPSLTVFLPPKEKANGAAVVICPGGGHRYLAIDHEGYDVARWLASQGVAGFVLKYRLANEEGSSYKVDVHALADARRAVRLVRGRAKEWGVDPARVGLMGFSAGGELAILARHEIRGRPARRQRPDRSPQLPAGFPDAHLSRDSAGRNSTSPRRRRRRFWPSPITTSGAPPFASGSIRSS